MERGLVGKGDGLAATDAELIDPIETRRTAVKIDAVFKQVAAGVGKRQNTATVFFELAGRSER